MPKASLTVVNVRAEQLMAKRFAKVDPLTLREPHHTRRYVRDLERLYGQVQLAMHQGIAPTAMRYVS
jgi:hypothetical protein